MVRGDAPAGNVIFLSAEDDPKNVLIPRLMAAGADRTRVRIVQAVKDPPERDLLAQQRVAAAKIAAQELDKQIERARARVMRL
jgi:hypothetical protein